MGSSPIRDVFAYKDLCAATLKIQWKTCRYGSMAEQLICNQQVFGSSPNIGFEASVLTVFGAGTSSGGIPEWPKGADCKSVSCAFGGSNPPSPTRRGIEQSGSSSGS